MDKTSISGASALNKGSTSQKRVSVINASSDDLQNAPTATTNSLRHLNFPACQINKASSQKFILKNLSGIKTTFLFDAIRYAPLQQVAPKEKSELEKAREQIEAESRKQLEALSGGASTQNMSANISKASSAVEIKQKKRVGFA